MSKCGEKNILAERKVKLKEQKLQEHRERAKDNRVTVYRRMNAWKGTCANCFGHITLMEHNPVWVMEIFRGNMVVIGSNAVHEYCDKCRPPYDIKRWHMAAVNEEDKLHYAKIVPCDKEGNILEKFEEVEEEDYLRRP